jgi:hypothetical protein
MNRAPKLLLAMGLVMGLADRPVAGGEGGTAAVASSPGDAARPLVAPREVRKLYADGKHNAFTALVRFRDRLWLAFRSATGHNSADGGWPGLEKGLHDPLRQLGERNDAGL